MRCRCPNASRLVRVGRHVPGIAAGGGIVPATGRGAAMAEGSSPRGAVKTILVVDDRAPIADALAALFEGEGLCVLLAADGLEVIRSRRPDLVLTDVMMPRLGGEGLCARIKGDPDLAGIRVVLMSGTERGPASCHPDGFIAKGSDLSCLLDLVEDLLSDARLRADRIGRP